MPEWLKVLLISIGGGSIVAVIFYIGLKTAVVKIVANMISCKFDASLMQVLMQVGIKNRVVDIFSACCNKEFRCKFVASLS